jgi:hypothetical protein
MAPWRALSVAHKLVAMAKTKPVDHDAHLPSEALEGRGNIAQGEASDRGHKPGKPHAKPASAALLATHAAWLGAGLCICHSQRHLGFARAVHAWYPGLHSLKLTAPWASFQREGHFPRGRLQKAAC